MGNRYAMTRSDILRILIVEDDQHDAKLLCDSLKRGLKTPCGWIVCDSLDGLKQRISNNDIGLVITDLSLPESIGIETYRSVAAAAGDTPVVILTGADSTDLAMECVREGAQDFVTKGDMSVERLGRTVQFAIERSKRIRAERERDAAAYDSLVAQRIQQSLYPEQSPEIDGIEIAGSAFPATLACGDIYDYFRTDETHVAIALGDVCGHGLPAAMTMMQLHACMRLLAKERWAPHELLAGVNTGILRENTGSITPRFSTLFFADLNTVTHEFTYASAGHQSFVLRNDGSTEVLDATGVPVGLESNDFGNGWESRSLQLSPGDTLLIPTDGFVETMDADKTLFGQDRLLEVAHQHRDQPLVDLIEAIRAESLDFSHAGKITDDMTAVAIRSISRVAAMAPNSAGAQSQRLIST